MRLQLQCMAAPPAARRIACPWRQRQVLTYTPPVPLSLPGRSRGGSGGNPSRPQAPLHSSIPWPPPPPAPAAVAAPGRQRRRARARPDGISSRGGVSSIGRAVVVSGAAAHGGEREDGRSMVKRQREASSRRAGVGV